MTISVRGDPNNDLKICDVKKMKGGETRIQMEACKSIASNKPN